MFRSKPFQLRHRHPVVAGEVPESCTDGSPERGWDRGVLRPSRPSLFPFVECWSESTTGSPRGIGIGFDCCCFWLVRCYCYRFWFRRIVLGIRRLESHRTNGRTNETGAHAAHRGQPKDRPPLDRSSNSLGLPARRSSHTPVGRRTKSIGSLVRGSLGDSSNCSAATGLREGRRWGRQLLLVVFVVVVRTPTGTLVGPGYTKY
mmetsp:Transcript_15831/g.36314  ORF Transcript_15831/g.36314 Transcript_15831/m.36314 type:complete len:203 (-) Transcript_15831:544-1152(-)